MKNTFFGILLTFVAVTGFAVWVGAGPAPTAITVTGKGRCTKCATKETVICQSVVIVEAGRDKALYYLTENEVATSFHDKLGRETKAVKVKGTVQRSGTRLKLTATSFEVTE